MTSQSKTPAIFPWFSDDVFIAKKCVNRFHPAAPLHASRKWHTNKNLVKTIIHLRRIRFDARVKNNIKKWR